jgi:hypothetical protein
MVKDNPLTGSNPLTAKESIIKNEITNGPVLAPFPVKTITGTISKINTAKLSAIV